MNLTYVPALKYDIEPLFQLSKDLIDRYENTSQIDYSKVLSWVQNIIERHIGEYTCVFRLTRKLGITVFILLKERWNWMIYIFFQHNKTKVSAVKSSGNAS